MNHLASGHQNNLRVAKWLKRYYWNNPDWISGTPIFRWLIEVHLRPKHVILDLGAGGGNHKLDFRPEAKYAVGLDISQAIFLNPNVHGRCQGDAAHLPFLKDTFDLIFANYVLEHLPAPEAVIREVYRVLKPGGVFVIRTPNLFHYVSFFSKVSPHCTHLWLRSLLGGLYSDDSFPTYYRCNTRRTLLRCFSRVGFICEHLDMVEKEPTYLLRWLPFFLFGLLYERIVNRLKWLASLRCNIFVIARKPFTGD